MAPEYKLIFLPLRSGEVFMTEQRYCFNCGQPLVEQRCKIICPRCGMQEDCSDAGLIDYARVRAGRAPQAHDDPVADRDRTVIHRRDGRDGKSLQ